MLDNIGDDMFLALASAYFSGSEQRLIISFASAAGEDYFLWVCAKAVSNGLAGAEKRFGSVLTDGVQGGGIAVIIIASSAVLLSFVVAALSAYIVVIDPPFFL